MSAIYPAALAVIVLIAGGFVMGWQWAGVRGRAALNEVRAEYQTRLAQGEFAARTALEKSTMRVQEVNDVRISELVQIATVAAGRASRTIRVCDNPAVSAAGDRESSTAADEAGTGAALLPEGAGPVAGTDISLDPLYDLARRADEVSADLRACQDAWPR